jgi:Phosphotransferase enzyme family
MSAAAGGFPTVRRLDAPALLDGLERAAGVRFEVLGPLDGGQVGAARVRWPDGHEGVLKWRLDYTVAQMKAGPLAAAEALRAQGYPAPATELVAQVDDAVVTVQELLPGTKTDYMDEGLFEQALALNARHVGALAGRDDVSRINLYLAADGPGYCLHEPLRRFDARTAALERWVAKVGADTEPLMPGDDVVHQDFHPGNMLSMVVPGDAAAAAAGGGADAPEHRLTGVIDWDGAGRGDAGFDLVTLRFGIHPAGADRAVVERLDALLDRMPAHVLRPAWAHMSLRMTDWAIRHFPSDEVATWVALAEQRMDNG